MAITPIEITLDINPSNKKKTPVWVSQLDNVIRTIQVTMQDGGTDLDASSYSVYVEGTKPDNKGFSYLVTDIGGTVSGAVVAFPVQTQMTACKGIVETEIVLKNGDDRIGSANFYLVVEKAGLAEDVDVSDTEIPGYINGAQQAAAEASQSATNAENSATAAETAATTAQEVLESIPSDYTDLSNDVNDLMNAIIGNIPLDLNDKKNAYPSKVIGQVVSFLTSSATVSFNKIVKVYANYTYTVKVEQDATPQSSGARDSVIVDSENIIRAVFALPTTAGATNTLTITSPVDGWLVLAVDKKYKSIQIESYEMAYRMAEVEERISGFVEAVHPNLELGNITISTSGWSYYGSTQRVRTAQGETIPLKIGDKIGLSDYSDARYYLGWRLSDGTYKAQSWVSRDTIVSEDGEYVILIANLTDKTQSSVNALGDLLQITHYYSADDFVKENDAEEFAVSASTYTVANVKGINHRGYNTVAPENTLPAYRLSRLHGFMYVETDVNYTSDGVLVCLHDETINRTARNADGTSITTTLNIRDITYEQALTYDFGIYKGQEYAGTKIPTFEEFISLCKNLGLHAYIELKFAADQSKLADCISIVKNYGMLENVTWIATIPDALIYIKNALPSARLGYVVNSVTAAVIANATGLKTSTNEVFINTNSHTDAECDLCKNADLPMEIWAFNNTADIIGMNPYISGVTSDSLIAGRVLYDSAMNG